MTVNYDSETYSFVVYGENFQFDVVELTTGAQRCFLYWGDSEDDKDWIERKCSELYDDIKDIEK